MVEVAQPATDERAIVAQPASLWKPVGDRDLDRPGHRGMNAGIENCAEKAVLFTGEQMCDFLPKGSSY
jgi:hypothetical protein